MRTYANQLIAFLLITVGLFAQSTVLTNSTILTGTTKMGAPTNSHQVTIEQGGTSSNYSDLNNGNANVAEASFFLTPTPSAGSITFNSLGMFVDTPDGAATTGAALYNVNNTTLTQATKCTGTNTPITGCLTGDTLYAGTVAGSSGGYAAGQGIFISGFTNAGNNGLFPVAVYNAAYLLLTNANGVTETATGQALGVGNFLCGDHFGTTPTNDIFNTLIPATVGGQSTACPSTLSSATWYAVVQVTTSATQNQSTGGARSSCPGTGTGVPGGMWSLFAPGSSVSSNPWPTNITFNQPAGTGPGIGSGDGCYAAYANLSYTTTSPFTIVQAGSDWQTATSNTPNEFTTAPIQAGNSLIVATIASTSANPALGVVTASGIINGAGGTTVDTLNQIGTCPGDGSYQVCFWSVNTAIAGANGIKATVSNNGGGPHNTVMYMEVQGSSSADKSAYDTADITTQAFTGAVATPTTSVPNELLIGAAVDITDCTAKTCVYTATSGWTNLLNIQNPGTGFQFPSGLFYQVVSATGAYKLSGTITTNGAGYAHLPGLATFK